MTTKHTSKMRRLTVRLV